MASSSETPTQAIGRSARAGDVAFLPSDPEWPSELAVEYQRAIGENN